MQLIGQKNNYELVTTWKKFPNFLIIKGEKHSGKKHFISYLCENLFKLKFDSVLLESYGVKEIREFVKNMLPNANVVFYIDNFENASLEAKNALLKVTEETPIGNYIVISDNNPLSTLESRAKILNIEPFIYADLLDLYKDKFPEIPAQKLFLGGINTPAKIIYYSTLNQFNDIIEITYKIADKITYLNILDILPLFNIINIQYDKTQEDICLLFLNILLNIIENKIKTNLHHSYFEILKIITSIKNQLVTIPTLNRHFLLIKMTYMLNQLQVEGKNL